MLQVGRDYLMVAIPKRGYVFTNWQPVNEFHYTITTIDDNGATNPPITSTVISLVPPSSTRPVLRFTMQPEIVIVDIPGTLKITESSGWQANFVPAEGAHSTETSRGTKILNDAHNGPEPDNPRQPKNPPHSLFRSKSGLTLSIRHLAGLWNFAESQLKARPVNRRLINS